VRVDLDTARALDAADDLAVLRSQFAIPKTVSGANSIYLCGHSLGLQPIKAAQYVAEVLESWRCYGVDAHFDGSRPWVSYHEQLTPALATLVGALPLEVVAMNSLSVNLHLLLASFYRPTLPRSKILIEAAAFPSDRYAVASQVSWHGLDPREHIIEYAGDAQFVLDEDALCEEIERRGSTIAVVMLPAVQYLTGQVLTCERIARVAHAQGCIVGLDLAHAIGNVPMHLHDWDVDFAVWCSYKYLNAGPGAIGGCFVHERHARAFDLPRLAGWWGHDKQTRFEMPPTFAPLAGAEGWQVSNPPILAAAPLVASLEIFQSASFERLRTKSAALTNFLAQLLRERLQQRVEIITPDAPNRGSQLSLRLNATPEDAKRVHARLNEAGVICDWREPNIIRVAPVPLYNRFVDVFGFVEALDHATIESTVGTKRK
jgi:kynureninase